MKNISIRDCDHNMSIVRTNCMMCVCVCVCVCVGWSEMCGQDVCVCVVCVWWVNCMRRAHAWCCVRKGEREGTHTHTHTNTNHTHTHTHTNTNHTHTHLSPKCEHNQHNEWDKICIKRKQHKHTLLTCCVSALHTYNHTKHTHTHTHTIHTHTHTHTHASTYTTHNTPQH